MMAVFIRLEGTPHRLGLKKDGPIVPLPRPGLFVRQSPLQLPLNFAKG